jgi:hypothetical protein
VLNRSDGEEVPEDARERVREQYEEHIGRYQAGIEAGGTTEEHSENSAAWRAWRRGLIAIQREAVLFKHDRGEIRGLARPDASPLGPLEESRLDG